MRFSLTVALLVALAGCGLPQQQSWTPAAYQPLNARISALTPGGPLFHVNRPAYVAMFYIAPGSGVSMLYPGYGSGSLSGRAFAGAQFARMRLNNQGQYIFTRASAMQPRYYFLIASERPLDISHFGAFGDGLRGHLGSAFGSFSAFDTMEEIARQALPGLPDDGSWTTDMYVDWPSVIHMEPGPARVLLDCGGYSMYVAAEYVPVVRSIICDPAREQAPKSSGDHPRGEEPDAEIPGEEEGADESPVQPRTRNALTRTATGTASSNRVAENSIRQRISASSQLSTAAVGERAWENALWTQARGARGQAAYGSASSYGGADGSGGSARPAPAASRSPATTASPAPGGARAPVATPSDGASSSGGAGTRSRPAPSQGN